MADRDQLYAALRNADAAGDSAGAARLAEYIRGLPADAPTPTGPDTEAPGTLATGAEHFGQGASFGFGDELAGLAGAAGDVLTGNAPQGVVQSYRDARDFARGRLDRGAAAHPGVASGAELAGALAVPIPGAGGGGLVRGALTGAAVGALTGAGHADELADVPGEALTGAALGGGAGAALSATARGLRSVGAAAGRLGDRLYDAAGLSTAKALAGGGGQAARKIAGGTVAQLSELGNTAVERGLASRSGTPNDAAIAGLRRSARAGMQSAIAEAEKSGPGIPLEDVLAAVREAVPDLEDLATLQPARAGQIRALLGIAQRDAVDGRVSAGALEKLKRQSQALVRDWASGLGTPLKATAGAFRRLGEDAVGQAGEEVGAQFAAAKGDFGLAARAGQLAKLGADKGANASGSGPGQLHRLVALAVGGTQGLAGMATAGLVGSPGGRAVGQAGAAAAAHGLERALSDPRYVRVLSAAAQRGPQAVAATHYLLQAQDPDYRDLTVGGEDAGGR